MTTATHNRWTDTHCIADLFHQTQSSQWISLSDQTLTDVTFQYDKTLKTVLMIALEELPEQALLALHVMAFLDSDEICGRNTV